MNNNLLYSIDNFYVGKLNISRKQGNLLVPGSTDFLGLAYQIAELTINGAIEHNNSFSENQNSLRDDLIYKEVYTLFLKQNENYLCLHDNNIYTENGDDYCNCLISFKNYFPKIDFALPNELTIKEAKKYFDIILKKRNGVELYNKKILHSINDFYVGGLDLLTEETIIESKITEEKNFINSCLLINGWWGCCKGYNNDKTKEVSHDFFKCLFIKNADRYYNIKDFNFYVDIDSADSFCHHLIPYKEYIEDFNMVPKDNISIYKAINAYQCLETTKTKSKTKKLNLKEFLKK